MTNQQNHSVFTGSLLGLIGVNLWQIILTGITFGICYPWAVCCKERWIAKHTYIDGRQLCFDGSGGQLFGKYIVWLVLTIVTFGIYGFWLDIKMKQWIVKHTHFA